MELRDNKVVMQLVKEETITIALFAHPEIEKPHCTKNDKRYEEPFEDDGAYAD